MEELPPGIGVSFENVDAIVKATVATHNFQRWNSTVAPPGPPEDIPALQHLSRVGTNNSSQEAIAVFEAFNSYFSSAAAELPWHDRGNSVLTAETY